MTNKDKIILDLCGGTGAWSEPYREAGYQVVLVTLPQYDVRKFPIPGECIYGILAAPPCTEFASSGARWWADKDPSLLEDALSIVDACVNIITETQPHFWVLENPVGRLRRLRPTLGPVRHSFDPCDYGDPYTKKTLLWGKFNLPTPVPVKPMGQRPGQPNAWYSSVGGKSQATKEHRSKTSPAFARAFFKANR